VRLLAPALSDVASGEQPSRTRAVLAAAVVGTTAAAVTYRLLRRLPESSEE